MSAENGATEAKTQWKVGELARLTGVSVRALHHYDAIGLLSPTARSQNGYRLYTAEDVVRLEQIVSLCSLGFSLQETRLALQDARFSPHRVLEMHLARLRAQIESEQRLLVRLERVRDALDSQREVSPPEFLRLIKAITMIEKHYTSEQLEHLAKRRELLGEDAIKAVEDAWPKLIAQVRAAMERGDEPDSPQVQTLAHRWNQLVETFTGGDPGIAQSLQSLYDEAREQNAIPGPDSDAVPSPEMMQFMGRAIETLKTHG